MTSKKKILEEILPLRIIREVEKWPVLYTRDCAEMPNTHFKNKVWNEVAKALIDDWETYSQAEKKFKDLTKKWRNLRDTFKRQILVDKKIREGHNIKKKKYVYYKHMSFLLPHMQLADVPEPPPPHAAPRRARAAAARRTRSTHAHDAHADALLSAEHIDEDKHFLMSLLPSFKRMNDDEKLTAKMEILNVIKNVRKLTAEPYACRLAVADHDHLAVKAELLTDVDVGADHPDGAGDVNADDETDLSECSDHSGQ